MNLRRRWHRRFGHPMWAVNITGVVRTPSHALHRARCRLCGDFVFMVDGGPPGRAWPDLLSYRYAIFEEAL